MSKTFKFLLIIFQTIFLSIFSIVIFLDNTNAQEDLIKKGIEQYRAENYEEALEILNEAYRTSPTTTVSYYLGLIYKQIGELSKAKEFFFKTITEKPTINDAYIELAHVLFLLDELEEAKKWLNEAEIKQIMPARSAFIRGLILLKEGKNKESREYFEKAKALDKNLMQAADFQISLSYLSERKIRDSRKFFQSVLESSQETDISELAKDYLSAIEKQIKDYKEWRISFTTGYIYDDNIVLKPTGIIGNDSIDKISGKRDSALVNRLKINYNPSFFDNFYFSGNYEFYYKDYFRNNDYNLMIHSVELSPGYNFNSGFVTLPISYHLVWFDDKEYMWLFYLRPNFNLKLISEQIAQLSIGYGKREILKYKDRIDPDEDRDSNQFLLSIGYFYPFKEGKGLFYSKYEYLYDDTDGKNWDSYSHRIKGGISYPVANRLNLNLAADYILQNYRNIHTLSGKGINGFPAYETKRKDRIFKFSTGFIYEISKFLNLNLNYTHTKNDSNFSIYDYKRNVYSIELSFNF